MKTTFLLTAETAVPYTEIAAELPSSLVFFRQQQILTIPLGLSRDQALGLQIINLHFSGDLRSLLFVANPPRCDHHIVYSLWISTALAALHKYFISCNISFPWKEGNLNPTGFSFSTAFYVTQEAATQKYNAEYNNTNLLAPKKHFHSCHNNVIFHIVCKLIQVRKQKKCTRTEVKLFLQIDAQR